MVSLTPSIRFHAATRAKTPGTGATSDEVPVDVVSSAGNTYRDNLARHHTARGEAAINIGLGVIVDDGFVAEAQNS
ncbi:hypothetical protein AnigIFM63309_002406 [Aspergillus niger]|nr:hypothetical protein AnigIFM63309_002406 [Aspergillus niger]